MVQAVNWVGVFLTLAFAAATLAVALWLAYAIFAGSGAGNAARALAAVLAAFVAIDALSGIITRDRRVPAATAVCFDDWCASVQSIELRDGLAVAHVQVRSVAKRVVMRPSRPHLFLVDASGGVHEALPYDGAPALDEEIAPGDSYSTRLAARVPARSTLVAARFAEGGGPGWINPLLLFDEANPLYRKTFVVLSGV